MSIKTGLFFFLTFYCIITPISGIIKNMYHRSLLYYGKFKKSGENKNKLRAILTKNHENLKTARLGSSFTGSYKRRV